jgi:hypothetical protein
MLGEHERGREDFKFVDSLEGVTTHLKMTVSLRGSQNVGVREIEVQPRSLRGGHPPVNGIEVAGQKDKGLDAATPDFIRMGASKPRPR